jgi:Uncharacterised protein family (UPF0158)
MELFIASVEDPDRAERLAVAIRGRGAFRRFKDELARWPGELERWHAFSEERQRGRARSWLAASGYRVLPSTAAIRENGPLACYQPERGTSPGRAEGRQTHARA